MPSPYGLAIEDRCVVCKLRNESFFCSLPTAVLQEFEKLKISTVFPKGAVLFVEGQTHQSVAKAQELSEKYENDELDTAVTAQIKFEQAGGNGYCDEALTHLGHALHTAEDRESPEHVGYQAWDGVFTWSGFQHVIAERQSAKSSEAADEEQRHLAYVAAAQDWQRFQAGLKKKRATVIDKPLVAKQ